MSSTEELLRELTALYQRQYVSKSDLDALKSRYSCHPLTKKSLKKQKRNYLWRFDLAGLKNFYQTEVKLYRYLAQRNQLNQKFIKKEQQKPYLIEGNRLDPQQIEAVVACEDAALFLAPAGSGKSASLLAKITYLTEVLKIPPEQILIIAFTNKVVAELKTRIKQNQVEIRTFHSLGNKIIKGKLQGYRLISEAQTERFFRQKIKELLATDQNYATKYATYLKNDALEVVPSFTEKSNQTDAEKLQALFSAVLSLQKSEKASLTEYKRRLTKLANPTERKPALEFFALYAPVVQAYQKYLREGKYYDFADMLNKSTDIVEKMPANSFNYQYILVDEAQDLSTSKYLLLKAILAKCQKVKLFAVGDDWQSIYRFAGSNLKVLDDFEKIFGRCTYRGLIELTYRFGQPTAKLSNHFIEKNPHQSRKKVKPHVKRHTPIEVSLSPAQQERGIPWDYAAVDKKLQALYAKYGEKLFEKKVQIIARYNRDIYRLIDSSTKSYQNAKLNKEATAQTELLWQITGAKQPLKVPFCSMHKAKGITRDIVFVINLNSGTMGMPATRGDDPVMSVLLTKLDPYPYAEERRLFYVAITRAKERTILVASAHSISDFVFEVSPKLKGANVKVCPQCKKGILVERRRRNGKIYYGCSNSRRGCRYTEQ